jgi:hypothetical protein
MSFKTLHSFTVNIDQEVDQIETSNENGQEVTRKSKVSKSVPHVIDMKELTRKEKQSLSLWYGQAYTEAIKDHGLAPKMLLIQKFSRDPESPLSQSEDKNLGKMYDRLNELENDLIRMNALPDNDDTKERREKTWLDVQILKKKIIDIESSYQSLFAHCAENYAQNRAITWLVLFMSYLNKGGENRVAFFEGKSFEDKENILDTLEDKNDILYTSAIEKLSTYWALYYLGHAAKPEDFKKIEEDLTKQLNRVEGDAKEEETPAPLAPVDTFAV